MRNNNERMMIKKKKKTTAGSDGVREKEEEEENDDFGEVRFCVFFNNYFICARSTNSWLLLPTSKTNRHKERERKSAGN